MVKYSGKQRYIAFNFEDELSHLAPVVMIDSAHCGSTQDHSSFVGVGRVLRGLLQDVRVREGQG